MVDIDKIQYGFMLGSGTGDAVFVLRRLSKKLRPKNKKFFFFLFADLENTFYQVPREVIIFALRWKGVLKNLLNGVMSLYKGCKTAVSVDWEHQVHFL